MINLKLMPSQKKRKTKLKETELAIKKGTRRTDDLDLLLLGVVDVIAHLPRNR